MDFVKAYGVDGDPTMRAFSRRKAAKDVGYYSQLAKDAGVQSLMSEGPLNALNAATDEGQGDQMVSQMVDFYAKKFSRK